MKLMRAERWRAGEKAKVVRGRLAIESHDFVPESWALYRWKMSRWW